MAKRPASQYYWGDWHRDLALQSCPLAARGLWHEMNCLMHQGEPYGHLTMPNGNPMTVTQLATLSKITARECNKLLAHLEEAGVFSRTESGTIYSRRMVRDEAVRNARAEGGKDGAEHGAKGAEHGAKGGRPAKDKGGSKTPLDDSGKGGLKTGLEPPPSSSSSSSSSSAGSSYNHRSNDDDGTSDSARLPAVGAVAVVDWAYSPAVELDLANLYAIPIDFADQVCAEFRHWWADKPPLPANEWDAKFLQRVVDQWERRQTQGAT